MSSPMQDFPSLIRQNKTGSANGVMPPQGDTEEQFRRGLQQWQPWL